MPLTKTVAQCSVVVALLSALIPGFAQESKMESQAIRCSAFFMVFADAADNSRVKSLQQLAGNFADAYVKAHDEKNTHASDADMLTRRETVLKELEAAYRDNQPALLQEAVLCGAWGEGFLLQGENITYVPIIPKIIPQKVWEEYGALSSAAFEKWMQADRNKAAVGK